MPKEATITSVWKRTSRIAGIATLAGALVLSGCGGEDEEDITAPTETDSAISSPTAAGSPEGSPGVSASPDASPDGSPAAMESIDVATAFENLLDQPSFEMEIDLEGLPVIAQSIPIVEDSISMRLEMANQDRHLTIMDDSGSTLFELWVVDEEFYLDIGQGATPLDTSGALGIPEESLIALADAPEQLIGILATDDATWEVTGEAEVNGFNTTVAEASYEVSRIADTIYFDTSDATIDAMLWVDEDEHFLVQMNADIYQDQPGADDGTPESGTPTTDGTPSTDSASQITIDVLSVGEIEEIEVPDTN